MTTYSFIDESGETRLVGTISPAPGGGSQPGVVAFPIAFGDAGLTSGVTFYTPTADDVAAGLWLLNAWFEITTAWDGTTPKGDFGTFVGSSDGVLSLGGVINDMTQPSTEQVGTGLRITNMYALAYANNGSPVRITATNPLKVVVSQTGAAGGASPGAAHGAGFLCYLIGKA